MRRVLGLLTVVVALVGTSRAEEPTNQASTTKPVAKNEALRQELLAMVKEDQRVRIEGIRFLGEMGIDPANPPTLFSDPQLFFIMLGESLKGQQIDLQNGQRLQQIFEEHGWPGKSQVGKDGAHAAWLLVQHQDANRPFQEKCLALMEAAPEGEVEGMDVAYLTDRVLVAQGKPQRYGTQMGANFEPRPIEDPENVDKRRAEVGLMPLDEYLTMAREAYEQMAAGKAYEKSR